MCAVCVCLCVVSLDLRTRLNAFPIRGKEELEEVQEEAATSLVTPKRKREGGSRRAKATKTKKAKKPKEAEEEESSQLDTTNLRVLDDMTADQVHTHLPLPCLASSFVACSCFDSSSSVGRNSCGWSSDGEASERRARRTNWWRGCGRRGTKATPPRHPSEANRRSGESSRP